MDVMEKKRREEEAFRAMQKRQQVKFSGQALLEYQKDDKEIQDEI
jgi:hypothetical protein